MSEKEEKQEKEENKKETKNPKIDIDKKRTQPYIEYYVEYFLRTLFFWEKDPIRLGTLIRFFHHTTAYCLIISFIIIHTIMPSFLLLCLYLAIWFIIWVHHIITGGCVFSKIEQSLLGDSRSFLDPILIIFHIPITKETSIGATMMGSTLILIFLFMEVLARSSLCIQSLFSQTPF